MAAPSDWVTGRDDDCAVEMCHCVLPCVWEGRGAVAWPPVSSSDRRTDEAVDPDLTHPFALARRPVEDDEQVVNALPVHVQPRLDDGARIELARLPFLARARGFPDTPPNHGTRLRRRDPRANLRERIARIRATDKLRCVHGKLSRIGPVARTARPQAPDTPRGAVRSGGAPCGGPMGEL